MWWLACTATLLAATAQQPTPAHTRSLIGVVVDMNGEPLAGATVWAAPPGEHANRSHAARSGADGRFRVRGVPETHDWRLHAEAAGHCRVSRTLGRGLAPLRIALQQAVTVRGVVRDADGRPVAGACVLAQPRQRLLGLSSAQTTSDRDGRFELPAVAIDYNWIGACSDQHGLVRISRHVTADTTVDLQFDEHADTTSVEIRFEGIDAARRDDVHVELSAGSFVGSPELPRPFYFRGIPAEPLVIANLPDDGIFVWVRAAGLRFERSSRSLPKGEGPHRVTFRVRAQPTATVDQRLCFVDTDGQPLSDVRVAVYGAAGQQPVVATTDARGGAALDLRIEAGATGFLYLRDGRWLIADSVPLGGPRDNSRFAVTANEPITIVLVPACSVAGRIVQLGGQPAAFAAVELQENVGGNWQAVARATSNANGDFRCERLAAHPRPLRVTVRDRQGSLQRPGIDLSEQGARVHLGDVELQPAATIHGTVLDAAGKPVAGATVAVRGADATVDFGDDTITDANGNYRLVGVPPGTLTMCFYGSGDPRGWFELTVAAGVTRREDYRP